jgi:hypothetical protein
MFLPQAAKVMLLAAARFDSPLVIGKRKQDIGMPCFLSG